MGNSDSKSGDEKKTVEDTGKSRDEKTAEEKGKSSDEKKTTAVDKVKSTIETAVEDAKSSIEKIIEKTEDGDYVDDKTTPDEFGMSSNQKKTVEDNEQFDKEEEKKTAEKNENKNRTVKEGGKALVETSHEKTPAVETGRLGIEETTKENSPASKKAPPPPKGKEEEQQPEIAGNCTGSREIRIADGDRGWSYRSLFSPYLGGEVRRVRVEDPYVQGFHQIENFQRFTEVLTCLCPNLQEITLVTTRIRASGDAALQEKVKAEQETRLDLLKQKLDKGRNIALHVIFSKTLHDRAVRLDTGWVFGMGRGLDLYKRSKQGGDVGQFELDLRECHECTVFVMRSSLPFPDGEGKQQR